MAQTDITLTSGCIHDPKDQFAYALGGKATFTLVSKKTGQRFTYRVNKGDRNPEIRLVSVLAAPDTYRSLGWIDRFKKYHAPASLSASVAAFAWWCRYVNAAPALLKKLEFWHHGQCSRCGRILTTPESIARGLGPVCAEKKQ